MKRYNQPETAVQTIQLHTVLMSSGGGFSLTSNIGLNIGSQTLDPTDAW